MNPDVKWSLAATVAVVAVVGASVLWPPGWLIFGLLGVALMVAVLRRELIPKALLFVAVSAAAGVGVKFLGDVGSGYTLLRFTTAAIAGLLVACYLVKALDGLRRNGWLIAFILWALVSVAWAPDFRASLMLFGAILGALLTGLVLASVYDRTVAMKLLLFTTATLAAVSVALALIVPSIGKTNTVRPDGMVVSTATGLFAWNSDLGFIASTAAILAAGAWTQFRSKRYFFLMVAMLGASIYTDSATAIVAGVAGFAAVVWFGLRSLRPPMVLAAILGAILYFIASDKPVMDTLLGLLGRDSNLTGRTVIWNLVLAQSAQHPIAGYGLDGSPGIAASIGFEAHAHNGYLQLLLELGWVGVVLFGLALLLIMVRILRAGDPVLIGVFTLFVVTNLANNYLVSPHLAMVLFGWLAFAVPMNRERVDRKSKLKSHPRPFRPELQLLAARQSS